MSNMYKVDGTRGNETLTELFVSASVGKKAQVDLSREGWDTIMRKVELAPKVKKMQMYAMLYNRDPGTWEPDVSVVREMVGTKAGKKKAGIPA